MVQKFQQTRRVCLYKILQVPQTASIKEIKSSYRKLALQFHPDMHADDPKKTAEFKRISEAYAVLSDQDKKNTYDFSAGIRYNRNRRTPPPPDYRSVKHPEKPKGWKTVWDHQVHYDMHYGDGMYQEILRQARKRVEAEYEYQSPIGKGFAFSKTNPRMNYNPYSHAPQGPDRSMYIEYEEVDMHLNGGANKAKEHVKRRVRATEDLHFRREQRREYQSQREAQAAAKQPNAAFSSPSGTCVIM